MLRSAAAAAVDEVVSDCRIVCASGVVLSNPAAFFRCVVVQASDIVVVDQ